MQTLVATERETYAAMWAHPSYREQSPGAAYLSLFQDMAQPRAGQTVLDAGCGAGAGAVALAGIGLKPSLCDITPEGLSEDAQDFPFIPAVLWEPLTPALGRHDWVYCCDVLEHIPPTFTMLVISRLLEVAKEGVFLSISLMPDQFGVWVGKPLHQTVQTFPQWREQIGAIAEIVECRDLLHCGIFLVRPRC